MPILANIVLFSWPLVAVILFATVEFRKAAILTIVLGYLLMPSFLGFNLPGVPEIDKHVMVGIAAIFGALIFSQKADPKHTLTGWLPKSWFIWLLFGLIIVGAFITVATNDDTLRYIGTRENHRTRIQPALTTRDGLSDIATMLAALLPFFLGRRYLADASGHRVILTVLAIAALIYTLPALWEIRMSPQIHKTIYGFHEGLWRQNIRGSTYRPYVFLHHGLPLSVFFMMGMLACLALWKSGPPERRKQFLAAGVWILLTLLLSKSLGSTIIAIGLAIPFIFFGNRVQLLSAAIIAVIVLSYPVTRANNLFPTDTLVSWSAQIDEARAQSLAFRFEHEEVLLDRALERPLAGWGGWGRSRVIDEQGRDVSVTDGAWVITLGENGWLRFIGKFGLFSLPLLIMILRGYRLDPATVAVIVIMVGALVNLLPNSHISPITWLIVGAVAGRLELGRQESAQPDGPTRTDPTPRGAVYTRTRQVPGRQGQPETSSDLRFTRQIDRHARQGS